MVELKYYNGSNYVSARDLHNVLKIKQQFSSWFNYNKSRALIEIEKDFYRILAKSTGGRPSADYYLTEQSAMVLIVMSGGQNAKQVRDEVLQVFQSRRQLELITPKEAALAYEFINFFKYIENQKEAYRLHQDSFVSTRNPSKYVYAEFAKHRANIVGWDKAKVNNAVQKYLQENVSNNLRKLMKESMPVKLSVMDINEAIRVSVLDLLFAKGTEVELANKFANMVKNVSAEMEIIAYKRNENTLFQHKEDLRIPQLRN